MLAGQLFRFSVVGTTGFLIDAALLHALLATGMGPYAARVPSFVAAVTWTWLLNRSFTFRAPRHEAMGGEWAAYIRLMLIGAGLNYGVYAVALWQSLLVREWPVIGVALGSIAGLLVNFFNSRRLLYTAPVR